MVDNCLKSAGFGVEEIGLFCCAAGPGSFTGLEDWNGHDKGVFAYIGKTGQSELIRWTHLPLNADGIEETVCPVIDARRGEVYTACYKGGERISEYRGIVLDAVIDELKGSPAVFLGDAAVNYREKILEASPSFRIAHPGIVLQRAGSVGLCAYGMFKKGLCRDAYSLEPFYLKETQAERNANKAPKR